MVVVFTVIDNNVNRRNKIFRQKQTKLPLTDNSKSTDYVIVTETHESYTIYNNYNYLFQFLLSRNDFYQVSWPKENLGVLLE